MTAIPWIVAALVALAAIAVAYRAFRQAGPDGRRAIATVERLTELAHDQLVVNPNDLTALEVRRVITANRRRTHKEITF